MIYTGGMSFDEVIEIPDAASLPKIEQVVLAQYARQHKDFLDGRSGGVRAILKFKDLSGLDMTGMNMEQADFTGSRLAGAQMGNGRFKGTSFFACDLRNANLRGADLNRADLRGAYMVGADLTRAKLDGADLREGKIMKRGEKGVLEDRARGVPGTKTVMAGVRLTGASLKSVSATCVDFSDADLTGAVITSAECRGAVFQGANLSDADLGSSDFSGVDLRDAVMSNTFTDTTDLYGAKKENVLTDDDMGDKLETLGKSLRELLAEHHLWVSSVGKEGRHLNLSGYDLRDVMRLNTYELTAIHAIGGNFLGQNLSRIHMQHVVMDKADFRDCVIDKADLRGSSFKYALFSRSDLRNAKLGPLYFKNPDGSKRVKRSDLSGANFRYADLRGTDFSQAIMMGVDLSYANLNGANLTNADLTGALTDNTRFDGAIGYKGE